MVGGSELAGCPSGSEYDWYQRASKLLESGNGAAASILFERLREIDSNPSVLEGLGRALLDAKRYVEAESVLDELVQNAPDND